MLNRKPNGWLVALSLGLLCTLGGRYALTRHRVNAKQEAAIVSVGKSYEGMGIMSTDDYRRILQLADSIKKSHSISDADLDWWIELVNRTSSKLGEDTGETRRLTALEAEFGNLTAVTPQQKDRLFELAKSYLPAPGQSAGKDLFFGVALIRDMDEKRAAPLLTQFLNRSPESYVRQMSEEMLKDWNPRQLLK